MTSILFAAALVAGQIVGQVQTGPNTTVVDVYNPYSETVSTYVLDSQDLNAIAKEVPTTHSNSWIQTA